MQISLELWGWLVAALLGVVEGITEFLPISSTGHLIVASDLLKFHDPGGVFDIVIQLGAVLAVVWLYHADLLQQARDVVSEPKVQRFWLNILVAFIPAAILGFLFKDFITDVLFSPWVVAVSLIVGGIVLWLVEGMKHSSQTQQLEQITLRQALTIGLVQVVALIPGVSRSGATIVGGLLSGLDRSTATAFSFYLAMPTLGAATLYALLKALSSLSGDMVVSLLIGLVVTFVVSLLVIRWLLRYVATNNFRGFAIYRVIAGVVLLILYGLVWR
ncbi:MAG: undecaprenyl-diphosphate phosphatase [Caldilineaceae bacterium]